ncbi:MAG: LysR family transcriptional regulator [Halioglobus sp.]
MDWDDMKVLLALSRKGSARAAAQALGVSNSTVTRRLDDMEGQLHTRLFDRTPDGYRMTASAELLLPTAEHVEELILGAERRIMGEDQELTGGIRLTMPDTGGLSFLIKRLAEFSRAYPGIELELMPSYDALDLSRREADIAIRVMPAGVAPPDYLIGRCLGRMTASSYVHGALLNPDRPEDVSHLTWIGKNPLDHDEKWVKDTDYPNQPVRHSILNVNLLVEAVGQRMGMGYMPCFAALGQQGLVQVPGASVVHHSDIWVLTHKDLRLSARMRVLREIIADEFNHIRHQLDSSLPVAGVAGD